MGRSHDLRIRPPTGLAVLQRRLSGSVGASEASKAGTGDGVTFKFDISGFAKENEEQTRALEDEVGRLMTGPDDGGGNVPMILTLHTHRVLCRLGLHKWRWNRQRGPFRAAWSSRECRRCAKFQRVWSYE